MKHLWVDFDNDPDYTKAERHGITGLFFHLYDPRVTPAYLKAVEQRGYQVGVYVASNWGPVEGDGRHFAEQVAKQVKFVAGPFLTNQFPKVQLDMEEHDPDKIGQALTRWRELRRYQDTSWTMEGGQGGWMSKSFVETVLKARVRIVPQLYNGAMTEVWDSLTYARDLTKRGFPDTVISPFYDAKHLPVGWDGWAFTQGRLP